MTVLSVVVSKFGTNSVFTGVMIMQAFLTLLVRLERGSLHLEQKVRRWYMIHQDIFFPLKTCLLRLSWLPIAMQSHDRTKSTPLKLADKQLPKA